jgi:ABC-type Mn2+/Zn2+ transport system permease subunit
MIDLLRIYYANIVAGCLAAAALSLIGCQLAARDRSMHTLCVSQGMMFGVLVGIVLFGDARTSLPYITGLLMAIFVGALTEWITKSVVSSISSYFVAFFLLILAGNHILGSLFPSVSSHLTQVFYGDLATVSAEQSWTSSVVSAAVLALLAIFHRHLSNQSFERFAFPEDASLLSSSRIKPWLRAIEVSLFLYLCYAIQVFGFLFTISSLFVPTVFLSLRRGRPGIYRHLARSALVMGLAVGIGLPLTLSFDNLPTVPTVATVAMLLAMLLP